MIPIWFSETCLRLCVTRLPLLQRKETKIDSIWYTFFMGVDLFANSRKNFHSDQRKRRCMREKICDWLIILIDNLKLRDGNHHKKKYALSRDRELRQITHAYFAFNLSFIEQNPVGIVFVYARKVLMLLKATYELTFEVAHLCKHNLCKIDGSGSKFWDAIMNVKYAMGLKHSHFQNIDHYLASSKTPFHGTKSHENVLRYARIRCDNLIGATNSSVMVFHNPLNQWLERVTVRPAYKDHISRAEIEIVPWLNS